MAQLAQKFSEWLVEQRGLPYRFRKSVIKRINPNMLKDHPFRMDFFGMQYAGNAGDYISRMVYFCGAYEKYMLFFLRDYLAHLHKNSVIFADIGANLGNHSLFMSQYVSQVHAFEPYEKVRRELEEKITVNNITNIQVHTYGLGAKNKTLPFYAPPAFNLGAGSFSKGHHKGNHYIADLDIKIGDEVFANFGTVNIVKMDVEGFERYVLEGLKNTLKKDRPLIILELSDTTRNSFKDFADFQLVFPENYTLLRFATANRNNGDYAIADFDYYTHYKRHDVIACPDEQLEYMPNRRRH